MLHIWYAIAFQFDSHLVDFPFNFFSFFQNFPKITLRFRVSVWVSVKVSVRVGVRVTSFLPSLLPPASSRQNRHCLQFKLSI